MHIDEIIYLLKNEPKMFKFLIILLIYIESNVYKKLFI